MFGMGFMEILLIGIIAIIALGPEKLPSAMVEVAKFIKKFKSGVNDAKSTLNQELNVSEMRDEADKFKAQLKDMQTSVSDNTKVNLGLDEIMKDEKTSNSQDNTKKVETSYKENTQIEKLKKNKNNEKVSFKESKKKDDLKKENESDKFKVKFDENKEENA